ITASSNLGFIRPAIAVRISEVRVGSSLLLLQIGQTVMIRVFITIRYTITIAILVVRVKAICYFPAIGKTVAVRILLQVWPERIEDVAMAELENIIKAVPIRIQGLSERHLTNPIKRTGPAWERIGVGEQS